MKTISRRKLLATASAVPIALAATGTLARAACSHDHAKMALRLGALSVDPALSKADRAGLLAHAACASCGTAIEPEGLSYGEHMRG